MIPHIQPVEDIALEKIYALRFEINFGQWTVFHEKCVQQCTKTLCRCGSMQELIIYTLHLVHSCLTKIESDV